MFSGNYKKHSKIKQKYTHVNYKENYYIVQIPRDK